MVSLITEKAEKRGTYIWCANKRPKSEESQKIMILIAIKIENTFIEFMFALKKEIHKKKRRRRERQKQPSDPVSHNVQQIDFNFIFFSFCTFLCAMFHS